MGDKKYDLLGARGHRERSAKQLLGLKILFGGCSIGTLHSPGDRTSKERFHFSQLFTRGSHRQSTGQKGKEGVGVHGKLRGGGGLWDKVGPFPITKVQDEALPFAPVDFDEISSGDL